MPTYRCSVCEAFTTVDAKTADPRCRACESKLDLGAAPQEVDSAALSRAIELSPVPLFVDFWAPWCGPCVWSAPIVKALAFRMAGEIAVVTLNTQKSPQAGETHAIYSIPTFALFQAGEEVSRRIGVQAPGELERWVRQLIAFRPAPPAAAAAHAT
jgi:thioredoxin 2